MKKLLAIICACLILIACIGCKGGAAESVSSEVASSRGTRSYGSASSYKSAYNSSSYASWSKPAISSAPSKPESVSKAPDSSYEAESSYDDTQSIAPARPIGQDKLHEYRNSHDMGSSRHLRGRVIVHCFFVDDNESSWTAEQSDRFLNEQIKPALEMIIAESKQWNINLTFDIKSYCNERADFSLKYNGTVNKDLMDGGSTKDIFNQMAVNMGYASDIDFTISDDASGGYTDSIYLTLINKKGRSYTRNIYVSGNAYYIDNDVSEHCIIFSQDLDAWVSYIAPKSRSATVAHEVLHLFGAEDYYKSQREDLAEQYYYYDIMTLSTRDISKLKIMEMTAFSIGWTNDVPELCYNSQWVGGRFEVE